MLMPERFVMNHKPPFAMARGHSLHSKIKSPFKILLPQEECLPIYLQLINSPIFKKALGCLLVSNLSTSWGGSQNFLTKNIRLLQTKWKGIICYQNKKPQCRPETLQTLKIIKKKTYTYTHTPGAHSLFVFNIEKRMTLPKGGGVFSQKKTKHHEASHNI